MRKILNKEFVRRAQSIANKSRCKGKEEERIGKPRHKNTTTHSNQISFFRYENVHPCAWSPKEKQWIGTLQPVAERREDNNTESNNNNKRKRPNGPNEQMNEQEDKGTQDSEETRVFKKRNRGNTRSCA
jgi:hypothetical protein